MRALYTLLVVPRAAAPAAAPRGGAAPRARLPRAHRRALRPLCAAAGAGAGAAGCTRCRWAKRAPRRRWSSACAAPIPTRRMLLTHMTATGRAAGRALFGDRVVQAWLPYDLPFAVRALPRAFPAARRAPHGNRAVAEPRRAPRAAGVPVFLVNARLSERSARGYARVPALDAADARARWPASPRRPTPTPRASRRSARATPVVTGNLKFDVDVPDAGAARSARELRAALRRARPVWLAALDARRRGGAAARRARRARRCRRHADRHRAAPSAAVRRGRRAAAPARHPVRRGAATTAPVPADVARRARRFDGRDVALLRGGRRRVRRRQPAAAGRPEPDRADRGRHGRRSSGRTCSISPKRRPKAVAAGAALRGRRCGRAGRDSRARCSRDPARRARDARGRARVPRARIAAPPTACGRGSRRSLPLPRRLRVSRGAGG